MMTHNESRTVTDLGNTVEQVALMMEADFAGAWYQEATREAAILISVDARRREIVFACCALESYIIEWCRDEVVKKDYLKLQEYVPEKPMGLLGKWRNAIRDVLSHAGKPTGIYADEKAPFWRAPHQLVEYRNGVVHGHPSRPELRGDAATYKPKVTVEELATLQAGWALTVAGEMIRHLHVQWGTPPPKWL